MVTVNEQAVLLPAASVAMTVTVVVPFGNTDPDGIELATVTPGQLSVAVGKAKLTAAAHCPGSVDCVMLAGHEFNTGNSLSTTVTVNVHVVLFPASSVAVTVTGVVPF